ncbi:Fc.00g092750.m01.CDS01 [Cosmosporella sp. VM-42]
MNLPPKNALVMKYRLPRILDSQRLSFNNDADYGQIELRCPFDMRRFRDHSDDEIDEEEDIPLHHKRPFGTGLKRQRVEFVPAKEPDVSSVTTATKPNTLIGDLYAGIVLKDASASSESVAKDAPERSVEEESSICPVCALPVTDSSRPHEASLAHQVCLKHSHPPSALDRSRMGLRALQSQGWDPDARHGLGREGEGMRYPIKVIAKEDTLGVGAKLPKNLPKKEEKPKKLNPKEMRRLAEKERLKGERLRGEIFGSVDVERYLRGDGTDG